MGRGTLGTSRGIAAATSAAAPTNSRPAAIQQHLVQAQRAIAREVDSLTPPRDGAWAGIRYKNFPHTMMGARFLTKKYAGQLAQEDKHNG